MDFCFGHVVVSQKRRWVNNVIWDLLVLFSIRKISLTGVITHDGLLYVVGGDDGTTNLSSVEIYNPTNNTWSMLSACMGIGRSYAGIAVINRPF